MAAHPPQAHHGSGEFEDTAWNPTKKAMSSNTLTPIYGANSAPKTTSNTKCEASPGRDASRINRNGNDLMTATHYPRAHTNDPRAHTNDPQASHDAAAALDENAVSALKRAILTLLATPMTAHELTGAYDMARERMGWPALGDSHNIARRVSELHNAGRIVDTGVKGPGRFRPATVWAVAE